MSSLVSDVVKSHIAELSDPYMAINALLDQQLCSAVVEHEGKAHQVSRIIPLSTDQLECTVTEMTREYKFVIPRRNGLRIFFPDSK